MRRSTFKRPTKAVLLRSALWLSLTSTAVGDLPIHCEYVDLAGSWEVFTSKASFDSPVSCGSDLPNTNLNNLKVGKDYVQWLRDNMGGIDESAKLEVDFTAEVGESPVAVSTRVQPRLLVKQKDSVVGHWTMVYDQGFDFYINTVAETSPNKQQAVSSDYFALMRYEPFTESACKSANGDAGDPFGRVDCYKSICDETMIGWSKSTVQNKNNDKSIDSDTSANSDAFVLRDSVSYEYKCFYARRVKDLKGIPTVVASKNITSASEVQLLNTANTETHNSTATTENIKSETSNEKTEDDPASMPVKRKIVVSPIAPSSPSSPTSSSSSSSSSFVQLSTSTASKAHSGSYYVGLMDTTFGNRNWRQSQEVNQNHRTPLYNNGEQSFLQMHASIAVPSSTRAKPLTASQLYACSERTNKKPDVSLWSRIKQSFSSSTHFPEAFSWLHTHGLVLNDANPMHIPDYMVINQATCGSCYAVAAAYTMSMRMRLAAMRLAVENGLTDYADVAANEVGMLSTQSVLSCAYYNQGCDGGYPYLVGKWAQDVGIPMAECQRYAAEDKSPCALPQALRLSETEKHLADSCPLFYAKDFGYVGGYYQSSNEEAMMEEILNNGPIVVALDAPEELFSYRKGILLARSKNHAGSCTDPKSVLLTTAEKQQHLQQSSTILNGWEYTDHAVVIVGWGVDNSVRDADSNDGDDAKNCHGKYWIVRNSWGEDWGTKGFVKICRGQNRNAIENQAVFVDPDMEDGSAKQLMQQALQKATEAFKRAEQGTHIKLHETTEAPDEAQPLEDRNRIV